MVFFVFNISFLYLTFSSIKWSHFTGGWKFREANHQDSSSGPNFMTIYPILVEIFQPISIASISCYHEILTLLWAKLVTEVLKNPAAVCPVQTHSRHTAESKGPLWTNNISCSINKSRSFDVWPTLVQAPINTSNPHGHCVCGPLCVWQDVLHRWYADTLLISLPVMQLASQSSCFCDAGGF